jgi:hypothetical protein
MKSSKGRPDPRLGAEAMRQALEVHQSGALRDVPAGEHVTALAALAGRQNLKALREALAQRYPGQVS